MIEDIVRAFALLLVFEGVLPFLVPNRWRSLVALLGDVSDSRLRVMGFWSMMAGVLILFLVKSMS